tara:strand:- start:32 stop:481 length:450 start_codon:yes stop_codon:yes gene_type:complete
MVGAFDKAWALLKGFESRYPPVIEGMRERSLDERYYPSVTMAPDAHAHLDEFSIQQQPMNETGSEFLSPRLQDFRDSVYRRTQEREEHLRQVQEMNDMADEMEEFFARNPELEDRFIDSIDTFGNIPQQLVNNFRMMTADPARYIPDYY